jgi:translation initiation factor 2 beta subunit (eIF-2beta)/eIF-5
MLCSVFAQRLPQVEKNMNKEEASEAISESSSSEAEPNSLEEEASEAISASVQPDFLLKHLASNSSISKRARYILSTPIQETKTEKSFKLFLKPRNTAICNSWI